MTLACAAGLSVGRLPIWPMRSPQGRPPLARRCFPAWRRYSQAGRPCRLFDPPARPLERRSARPRQPAGRAKPPERRAGGRRHGAQAAGYPAAGMEAGGRGPSLAVRLAPAARTSRRPHRFHRWPPPPPSPPRSLLTGMTARGASSGSGGVGQACCARPPKSGRPRSTCSGRRRCHRSVVGTSQQGPSPPFPTLEMPHAAPALVSCQGAAERPLRVSNT